MCNLHLRAFPVVVGESPFLHGRIGKSPAFQVLHGVKVLSALFGGCLLYTSPGCIAHSLLFEMPLIAAIIAAIFYIDSRCRKRPAAVFTEMCIRDSCYGANRQHIGIGLVIHRNLIKLRRIGSRVFEVGVQPAVRKAKTDVYKRQKRICYSCYSSMLWVLS